MVVDNRQNEHVVFGKGIAFGKVKGDEIDESRITKKFTAHDLKGEQLFSLIQELPETCLEVSHEIIEYAESILKKELSDFLYLTLTDHIAFVLQRYQDGIMPSNPLKWEIKRYYPKEYEIGKKAAELISEEFSIELNDDEAASLALHIVNGELDFKINDSVGMIELIDEIIQIIQYHTVVYLDMSDFECQRLMTHLKFFVQRLISGQKPGTDHPLFDIITQSYPKAYEIAEKIREYVSLKTNYEISKDELTYLTIHIQRLLDHNKQQNTP